MDSQEIFFKYLEKNEYTFDSNKDYEYINDKNLSRDTKTKLIEMIDKLNYMPKNFLEFIFSTYINYLKEIYNEQVINNDVLEAYNENKFGIIIKIEKAKPTNQQLVFYCSKEQKIYEQFFLIKTLTNKEYYPENIKISLDSNSKKKNKSDNIEKTEKAEKSKNKEITDDKNKDFEFIKKNKAKSDIEKNNKNKNSINYVDEKTISNIKDNIFCRFIKGNILECEICNYLRTKINESDDNMELINVIYAIKEIEINNQKIKSMFYHEFDSVFCLNEDVEFDENILKINCKYEDGKYEDTKNSKNKTKFVLKKNNIVFVEVKNEANFPNAFNDLFSHIYKFRSLLDNIYQTKGYGTIILFLYNNKFIYDLKDFRFFKLSIDAILKKNKQQKEMENYSVYAVYSYDNVFIYNYSIINKELAKVKNILESTEHKLESTEHKLELTQQKLESTENSFKQFQENLIEQLKKYNINIDIKIPNINNNMKNNINNDNHN